MPSLRAEGDQNRRERLKTTEAASKLQHGPSKTRSYNDDSTPVTISYSGAPVGDLSYSWDANKNKTSESIGGIMSGYGFSAGYDAEDRVIRWDRADTNLDQSRDLSPVGDWNSITENTAVQNRTHGLVHEILTAGGQSVEHDAKGNMTSIPSSLRPTASPLALSGDGLELVCCVGERTGKILAHGRASRGVR